MSLFATFAANLFLLFGTLVCSVGALLTSLVPPRGHWPYRFAVWWSKGWLACARVRVEVEIEDEARKAFDSGGPFVFAANHQSLLDIPVLIASLPIPARFLAKRSLFRIPVFGQAIAAAGFIPVDRGDRARAGEAFVTALRQLEKGRSVMVFPEETRSLTGRILPFKRGALLMAMRAQVSVAPIGVCGTRTIQAKGSLKVTPGVVTVRFGAPRSPNLGTPAERRALLESLRGDVVRLSGMPAEEAAEERAAPSGELR
jgi:1-acyl-sn-glycerol-3-phosphate acyltransferase